MAKKLAKRNQPEQPGLPEKDRQLLFEDGTWVDEIPTEVKRAANAYVKASAEASRASGKKKSKKENAIAIMKEHNVARVRVQGEDGNWEWLVATPDTKLEIKAYKEPADSDQ